MTDIAERITTLRFGVDWKALNYVGVADLFRVPILLFHGAADKDAPIATSDALAAARPDLVTYVRTEADHGRSWNLDPEGYSTAVGRFIQRVDR
jgi:hypothetical protein